MSASDEWTEWHLTSSGWERGFFHYDNGPKTGGEAPSDRALTVRLREVLSSVFSKYPHYSHDVLWRCDDEARIVRLVEQFGDLPPGSKKYR